MAQSITLNSSGASASRIALNPVFNETTMQVTVTAGSSGAVFVQVALDDFNVPGTVTGAAGAAVTWANLSSQINSSGIDGLGTTYTVLSPLSGIRLFGVATSSSGGVTQTTATLKVLQSITG